MTDMKRRTLLGGLLASAATAAAAGDALAIHAQWPRQARTQLRATRPAARWTVPPDNVANTAYVGANRLVLAAPANERLAVMMGDSITYGWEHKTRPFFKQHGLIGRGIGGETSGQMLLRFRPDVIALKPKAVHIMAGTNDLCEPRRPYDPAETHRNIETMATLARDSGIAVILASVPPISHWFKRRPEDKVNTLRSLNDWIKDLCAKGNYTYCDYWPVLSTTGDRLERVDLGARTRLAEAAAAGNATHTARVGAARTGGRAVLLVGADAVEAALGLPGDAAGTASAAPLRHRGDRVNDLLGDLGDLRDRLDQVHQLLHGADELLQEVGELLRVVDRGRDDVRDRTRDGRAERQERRRQPLDDLHDHVGHGLADQVHDHLADGADELAGALDRAGDAFDRLGEGLQATCVLLGRGAVTVGRAALPLSIRVNSLCV